MKRVPVFFDKRMCVESGHRVSPSSTKAAAVVADWRAREMAVAVRPVRPVTTQELRAVHDIGYVSGVLGGTVENGFGTTDPAVAVAAMWQCGSLLTAAKYVLLHRKTRSVACSPSSGFHHARRSNASGFCTFNGLAVTAHALLRGGMVSKVGILDLDYHFGDGTETMVQAMPAGAVTHFSAGLSYTKPEQAADLLKALTVAVTAMRRCDIVLYQAGADQHVLDPLGGIFTTRQMMTRDSIVFHACRELRIPLVWNLAGGYQRTERGGIEPVLTLHRQTMERCISIYGEQP